MCLPSQQVEAVAGKPPASKKQTEVPKEPKEVQEPRVSLSLGFSLFVSLSRSAKCTRCSDAGDEGLSAFSPGGKGPSEPQAPSARAAPLRLGAQGFEDKERHLLIAIHFASGGFQN